MVDLTRITGFAWDEGNTRKNEKHGVLPMEAEQVFFNQPLLLLDDVRHSQVEPRFHALGKTHGGRLLHIAFAVREEATKIRIVSARDMHRKERKIYAQET